MSYWKVCRQAEHITTLCWDTVPRSACAQQLLAKYSALRVCAGCCLALTLRKGMMPGVLRTTDTAGLIFVASVPLLKHHGITT